MNWTLISLVLIYCTIFGMQSHASNWRCHLALRFASHDQKQDAKIIEQTYNEVWNELGNEITPETIESMVRSGDPYHIPNEIRLKNETLAATFKEFHQMLDETGKDTIEVRLALIEFLKARLIQGDNAKKIIKKVMEKSVLPDHIGFNASEFLHHVSVDPQGRYLIAKGKRKGSLWISMNYGPFKPISTPYENLEVIEGLVPSHNGDHIFYSTTGMTRDLYRAEIIDKQNKPVQKINPEPWIKKARLENGNDTIFADIQFLNGGKSFIAEADNGIHFISALVPHSGPLSTIFNSEDRRMVAKFLPHSNKVLVVNSKSIQIVDSNNGSIKTSLELSWHKTWGKSQYDIVDANYTSRDWHILKNHKKAYTTTSLEGLIEINLKTGKARALDMPLQSTPAQPKLKAPFTRVIKAISIDTNERYIFMLVNSQMGRDMSGNSVSESSRVMTYDLKNKKIVKWKDLNAYKGIGIQLIEKFDSLLIDYQNENKFSFVPTSDLLP